MKQYYVYNANAYYVRAPIFINPNLNLQVGAATHLLTQGMVQSACLEPQLDQRQLTLATKDFSSSEVRHAPARPMASGQVQSQAVEVGQYTRCDHAICTLRAHLPTCQYLPLSPPPPPPPPPLLLTRNLYPSKGHRQK